MPLPYAKTLIETLKEQAQALQHTGIANLVAQNPSRTEALTFQVDQLTVDFSKTWLDEPTRQNLLKLAIAAKLPKQQEAMFCGKEINSTEQRAVLHTALRNTDQGNLIVAGKLLKEILAPEYEKLFTLAEAIENQSWLGYSGEAITDIVNIGIGGSDLGPRMVYQALAATHATRLKVHFVSNVDATDLQQVLQGLNPKQTLFIVASKSFTTQETLLNATTARQWLLAAYAQDPKAVASHFLAITSRPEKAIDFGIAANNILCMWDFVGGRYSLWSTIGLPILLGLGRQAFEDLLAGASAMDQHFQKTPLPLNLPVHFGLLGIWYRNFFQLDTYAVLPYDMRLELLPSYLQQAIMESNGKSVNLAGQTLTYGTSPIVWGGVGTNGQHAFHQLLHQGTTTVPADFIIAKTSNHPYQAHHEALWANALAQAQALMCGKSLAQAKAELLQQGMSCHAADKLAPHKVIPGNKPSHFIILESLTPRALGNLIALYEHKIFVESTLWQINAFDQWGVELGKQLAEPILANIRGEESKQVFDASTEALLSCFKNRP